MNFLDGIRRRIWPSATPNTVDDGRQIDVDANVAHGLRRTISHTVHRACPGCGAPSVYKTHESILAGWPAYYVPPGDVRADVLPAYLCECGVIHTEACCPGRDMPSDEVHPRGWRRRCGIEAERCCLQCGEPRNFEPNKVVFDGYV